MAPKKRPSRASVARTSTFDENYTIFSDGELWFKDRNIIFVGERGCFEPGKAKVNYHDNPGCMVIPG